MLADNGAHWSNVHRLGSPYDNVTILEVLLAVLVYCFVCASLVWYLDNVWPWQYGIPKTPLFFIKVEPIPLIQ